MALLPNISLVSIRSKVVFSLAVVALLLISHVSIGYIFYFKGKSASEKEILTNTISHFETYQKELSKQQETFNKNVDDLNKKLANHSQTVKVITNNTEREIEKVVYRDTIVPPSGMQLLADNADSLNAKRIPDSKPSEVQLSTNTSNE